MRKWQGREENDDDPQRAKIVTKQCAERTLTAMSTNDGFDDDKAVGNSSTLQAGSSGYAKKADA